MELKKYHLSPKAKLIWAGKLLVLTLLIIIALYLIAITFFVTDLGAIGGIFLVLGGIVLFLLLIYLGYVHLRYENFTYAFGDKEFILEEGIIVKKSQRIPYEKIQNVSIIYDIPHRLLNVGKVVITTAATDIKLSEFSLEALDRPHDFVTQLLYRVEKRDEMIYGKKGRRRKVKKSSGE